MAICYILEAKEKRKIKQMFRIIKTYKEKDNYIFEVPIKYNKSNKELFLKLTKKINKLGINTIVPSINLQKKDELYEILANNNIKVLDGRFLFKYLITDILEFIERRTKKELNSSEISILINNKNSLDSDKIIETAKKVKVLNIVTENISEFKNTEEYLYNNFGIMIKVSNNKKIDLVKSHIIINIDFKEDNVNQYRLPNKSIIINLAKEIKIKQKKFNGINVNNYEIQIPREYIKKGFSNEIICEANFLDKKLSINNIQIVGLVGNKGRISSREYKNIGI